MKKDKIVIMDCEVYQNFFLVVFKQVKTGKLQSFRMFDDEDIDTEKIKKIMRKYTIVSFNGIFYDNVILDGLLAGFNNKLLYKLSGDIIQNRLMPWVLRRKYNIPELKHDCVDIMNVSPLRASLKIYAGRLNAPKLQDLPIKFDQKIQESDLDDLLKYCINDVNITEILFNALKGEIDLRHRMSKQYGIDLRSKSDAQIAEQIIKKEIENSQQIQLEKPTVGEGTVFRFEPPDNIEFETEILDEVLDDFASSEFLVGSNGHIQPPACFKKRLVVVGATTYKVGIGGLHSTEKSIRHVASADTIIRDYDVAAYYPNIILENKLAPKHLGKGFLRVYQSLVTRRLKAKAAGNHTINETLKIVINGSFGKLANKWSYLYAPDLMLAVTAIGQLSLLMLIERLELAGVPVVSANTDGIVVKLHKNQAAIADSIVADWEFDTNYQMEANDYISLNSRDVNNYIGVTAKGIKAKGAYAEAGLRVNPANEVCSIAVKQFLQHGTPIEQTIMNCTDITKFLTLRTVNGGAVAKDKILGKSIRWYYCKNELDAIYYVTSGNKVPRTDGAVPLMDIQQNGKLPDDIDFKWYIEESLSILKQIGFIKTPK